jgi:DNA polymerase I
VSLLLCLDLSNLVARYHFAAAHGGPGLAAAPMLAGAAGALHVAAALIDSLSPSHLLVARDSDRATSVRRLTIYPKYKANRSEPDEGLVHNVDATLGALDVLRWPVVGHDGWEAGDVIASACAKYPGQVVIVSGDQDLLALCSDRVALRLLRRGGIHMNCGPAHCMQLLGVQPHQVRDYKALAGDQSDGISGIPGVGPRTAAAALKACGSLKVVYKRLDANESIAGVTDRSARMLRENRELARRSWRLAGLNDALAVDVDGLDVAPALTFDQAQTELSALGLDALFLGQSANARQ